jgi:acyl-CoA reductase-like NAD-dependent aldehyde dehydrogenase
MYTGSYNIGREVPKAANKHLTPVCLEMGGKSPVFFDTSVPNLEMAWRRILWGKCVNAGQTCVAPDYVLCTEEIQEYLLFKAVVILREFFGDDPQKSPDLARIVNLKQFLRLRALLKTSSGNIAIGGETDEDELFVAPTILSDVSLEDDIMKTEIFGPILPIVVVKDEDEAIRVINGGEKPLSLYVFSGSDEVIQKFVSQTSSGTFCANDVVVHLSVDTLPFGGVGASGMGAYHGKYTFDTFSHQKPILIRGYNPIVEWAASKRYPPYSENHMKRLIRLLRKRNIPIPPHFGSICIFLLGALFYHYILQLIF